MTVDDLWEALKEVAGINRNKSDIKTLVQIRREDVKKALDLLVKSDKIKRAVKQ